VSDGGGRLADRVAVVTGAGAHIGRAVAEQFAAEGAAVVVAETDTESGQETADRIVDRGGTAEFVETDVTDADDGRRVVGRVKRVVKLALVVEGQAHGRCSGPWIVCVVVTSRAAGDGPRAESGDRDPVRLRWRSTTGRRQRVLSARRPPAGGVHATTGRHSLNP